MISKLSDLMELRVPEDQEDKLVAELEALSPDPSLLDYIFHPHLQFEDGFTPSVEQAVDRALSYRPLAL